MPEEDRHVERTRPDLACPDFVLHQCIGRTVGPRRQARRSPGARTNDRKVASSISAAKCVSIVVKRRSPATITHPAAKRELRGAATPAVTSAPSTCSRSKLPTCTVLLMARRDPVCPQFEDARTTGRLLDGGSLGALPPVEHFLPRIATISMALLFCFPAERWPVREQVEWCADRGPLSVTPLTSSLS